MDVCNEKHFLSSANQQQVTSWRNAVFVKRTGELAHADYKPALYNELSIRRYLPPVTPAQFSK